MAAISTIRNIGPATEALYNAAGIMTAQALRDMGADAAYARLLQTGNRPHFIGYYALHMACRVVLGTTAKAKKRRRCATHLTP